MTKTLMSGVWFAIPNIPKKPSAKLTKHDETKVQSVRKNFFNSWLFDETYENPHRSEAISVQ